MYHTNENNRDMIRVERPRAEAGDDPFFHSVSPIFLLSIYLLKTVGAVPTLCRRFFHFPKEVTAVLTAKQEQFARKIVEGMNQADAYRNSYSTKKMSDNAIYREASLLIANPKVAQRIKELRDDLAKDSIMTAQERLEYLTGIARGTAQEKVTILVGGAPVEYERKACFSEKMKAIDLMNKMTGEYVTKIQGDVNVKLEDLL